VGQLIEADRRGLDNHGALPPPRSVSFGAIARAQAVFVTSRRGSPPINLIRIDIILSMWVRQGDRTD